MRKIIALSLLLAMALPGLSAACGGFFPAEKDILQTGQSVVFAVDHSSQMVSVYMSLSYTGDAEDFAWVVPVPQEPRLELSDPELFLELNQITKPSYTFPKREDSCFDPGLLLWAIATGRLGVGGALPETGRAGVDLRQQGQLGPYDYAVIRGTDANALASWLRENGYKIEARAEPLIKVYSDEGMLFVAMKLSADQPSSAIRPVKLSFQGDTAMLPLRFSAVAAEPRTDVRVWVFDQTQVAPEGIDRMLMPDDAIVIKRYGQDNYDEALYALAQSVNGRGFVTEYAQPSRELKNYVSQAELKTLFETHAFLTRLSTSLSPEQMSYDPVFIASPDLPTVSHQHDLTNRISPYSCQGELRSEQEQIVQRGTLQAIWIQHRWRLPWLIIAGLIIAGIMNQVRKLFI